MENSPKFIVDIYSLMSKQKVLLTYMGDITHETTNSLLQLLNKNSLFDQEVTVKKKLHKIMVECLENITRHAEVLEKAIHPSIFVLGRDDEHYHIFTGNYITDDNISPIKDALDYINALDRDEVKKKHLEALSGSTISAKGGAGIGLIDIALKSGNKLAYDFVSAGNNISFYILDVKVNIQ